MNAAQKTAGILGFAALCMALFFPVKRFDLPGGSLILEIDPYKIGETQLVTNALSSIRIYCGENMKAYFRTFLFTIPQNIKRLYRNKVSDGNAKAWADNGIGFDYAHLLDEVVSIATPTILILGLLSRPGPVAEPPGFQSSVVARIRYNFNGLSKPEKIIGFAGIAALCVVLWFPVWRVDFLDRANEMITGEDAFTTNVFKPAFLNSVRLASQNRTQFIRRFLFLTPITMVYSVVLSTKSHGDVAVELQLGDTTVSLDYFNLLKEILFVAVPTFLLIYAFRTQRPSQEVIFIALFYIVFELVGVSEHYF